MEFDPEKVKGKTLSQYADLCRWAIVLANANSGDAAIIAGYAGNSDELDDAITRLAFAYDAQNKKDYKLFKAVAKR